MSRNGFPSLDHEPKNLGIPPPSYRSTVIMDTDTWSQYSTSSAGLMKRRNSWTNLVESDENLNKHKINCYPKVTTPFKQPSLSSANSVASEVHNTDVFRQYMPRGSFPVLAEPVHLNVRPAGSLPPVSRGPSKAPSVAMSPMPGSTIPPKTPMRSKRNRLQEWKQKCCKPMCLLCCLLLGAALIVGAIIAVVLTQVLPPPDKVTAQWYPPENVRGPQNQSSSIQMTTNNDQLKFQLHGGLPFKGNYISYYDFKTNRVIIIDESLKGNGRNLACFVMPLDRGNLRDETAMRRAASASKNKGQMTTGWEESWIWIPNPMVTPPQFSQPIKECDGARWIQLDQAGQNQKMRKCSDCFDFCIPDYGIDKQDNKEYLNVKQRDCFYLFVPEWRSYAQANSIEQNQRDFEMYYRNRNHLNPAHGIGGESKWIPLSVPPGMANVVNQTGQSLGTIEGAIQGTAQGIGNTVFGSNGQPGLFGNMANTVSNGANQAYQTAENAVTGVVNLHGINGNNGNTLYQTGSANNRYNGQLGDSSPYGTSIYQNVDYSRPINGQSTYTNGQTNNGQNMNALVGQSTPYTSMNGVNGQTNGVYVPNVSNPSNQNYHPQATLQLNAYQPYSSSSAQTSPLDNRPSGIGVVQQQTPVYNSGYQVSSSYSGDVIKQPSGKLHPNLLSQMSSSYQSDGSSTAYGQPSVQGIAGMELSRQNTINTGNSAYPSDVVAQTRGQWPRTK